jgi:phosphoglycolate phosphatase-like HAD superfamily hydrolase
MAQAHEHRIAAIIFDLDGTLVDTAALHIASSHAAVRAVLGRDVDDETVHASLGRPLPESVALLARGAGIAGQRAVAGAVPSLVEAFLAYYAEHQAALVHPFARVPETLTLLRQRGYLLGLLSNKLRAWGSAELIAVGLEPFFACAVFAEDMPAPKPAPSALAPIIQALALPAGRMLMVGDGVADIACARAAGALSAAALWGAVAPAALRALDPDLTLDSIEQVLDLLPGNRSRPRQPRARP